MRLKHYLKILVSFAYIFSSKALVASGERSVCGTSVIKIHFESGAKEPLCEAKLGQKILKQRSRRHYSGFETQQRIGIWLAKQSNATEYYRHARWKAGLRIFGS
jgi:hypothetical protein